VDDEESLIVPVVIFDHSGNRYPICVAAPPVAVSVPREGVHPVGGVVPAGSMSDESMGGSKSTMS
jgi:hypothetical protein